MSEILVVDDDIELVLVIADEPDIVLLFTPAADPELTFVTPPRGPRGATGPAGLGLPTFHHGGLLEPLAGRGRIPNDTGHDLTLGIIRASIEIPCVGTPVIVDFRLDDVSIGHPLSLLAGTYTVALNADTTWPSGVFLSVEVPQVGDIYPGDTLTASASAQ